ncbi:hypothetical protein JOQ06_005548 [Pogonophryne albipinna]|uniref:RAB6-interacting golgin n=1 Tax=Pogonophryne albipinna TaxID=1090488 RepID=A0AAD6BHP0_9TELE|nr:hypothetical protein JOQ06_005548 [Pogonophryne albipinna]
MSGWAGFSDEELRKMQPKDAMAAVAARGRKPAPANRSRQQIQREKALQMAAQKNIKPAPEEEIPAVKELEKQEVALREQTRLEHLQQEQKLIEERNKRKKALLTKTIAEKSKQTQAEAVKLKRIQKELQALDDMVSNDIGILRSRIEQASWEFSGARKRYEKAEVEYVQSKLDLHKKTEVKEQLTEHLCAIIQQNELRKAHKLEELMQQLHLQTTEEELEKQREEERGGFVETQKKTKQENGSLEKQEGTVRSSEDCKPTEEEEEKGGDVQQEHHPMTEPPKPEQECKKLENGFQSELVAS